MYELEAKKKKDDSEVVNDADHEPPVRLYKINVKDKKITRLSTNTDWIEDFEVSRDGKYAVASHAKSLHYSFDHKVRPIVVLHDLASGQEKQVMADLRLRPEGFDWADDNSGFYVVTPFSTDKRFLTAGITIAYFFDVSTRQEHAGWSRLAERARIHDADRTRRLCDAAGGRQPSRDRVLCGEPQAETAGRGSDRR